MKRSPVEQFRVDLELVTGESYPDSFVRYTFDQHPQYVQSTGEIANRIRSHVQPLSTERRERTIDEIKAKYRPIIERLRSEQKKGSKRHAH